MDDLTLRTDDSWIAFDWDDTLLSSSWLAQLGLRLDSAPEEVAECHGELKCLARPIVSTLRLALEYDASVTIIANAETGWVQLAAAKLLTFEEEDTEDAQLPSVLDALKRVTILSARSRLERCFLPRRPCPSRHTFPSDSRVAATQHPVQPRRPLELVPDRYRNIISFGDSHVEREAVRAVVRGMDRTRCKSVKLSERPTPGAAASPVGDHRELLRLHLPSPRRSGLASDGDHQPGSLVNQNRSHAPPLRRLPPVAASTTGTESKSMFTPPESSG
jgi:hypothetical protein